MPKPAPERLLPATYPVARTVEPRFGDMDALRHLNNVAIARIYEDGRVRFTEGCGLRDAIEPGHGLLVAEVTLRYLAEGHYPDALQLCSGIAHVGTSSLVIAQALFQAGRCIGTAETALVHVHRKAGGARPLNPTARAALEAQRLRSPS